MGQVVGYRSLEVRGEVWAGDINMVVFGIQMVLKAKVWMKSPGKWTKRRSKDWVFQHSNIKKKEDLAEESKMESDQKQEENLNVKFWKQNEENVSRRREVSAMSNAMNSSKMGIEN